ncbi:uncharacterized protein LOC135823399 [Sycon ciliatum]|uniref:uncharacterized protein LOC135823399 n=1 Tax=Sycon ciliatum TaxID=27933 RepID=UPI0031F5F9F8
MAEHNAAARRSDVPHSPSPVPVDCHDIPYEVFPVQEETQMQTGSSPLCHCSGSSRNGYPLMFQCSSCCAPLYTPPPRPQAHGQQHPANAFHPRPGAEEVGYGFAPAGHEPLLNAGLICQRCNFDSISFTTLCMRMQREPILLDTHLRFHNVGLYLGFSDQYLDGFLRFYVMHKNDFGHLLFYLLRVWKRYLLWQSGKDPCRCLLSVLRMAGEPDLATLYEGILEQQGRQYHV